MPNLKKLILKNGDIIPIEDETARNNIQTLSTNKVDKITGKGLSTNDYTTAEKTKLASLSPITISSTLTLTVAGWDSTTKQQTVALTVDTEKRNVIDITVGELPLWSEYNVYAISESATGITFKCDTIPEEALTFRVTSMSVTIANGSN